MAKHDMEMHLVRPDFVGRTSVLQAIPGYSPVENAMDVAQRFVSLPYYTPGGGFAGPFGADVKPSFRDRVRLAWYRFKLRFAAMRANKLAAKNGALPVTSQAPAVPPVTSSGLAPAATGKEQAALMLTAGMASSGEAIMPPAVVKPEIVAGAQLHYNYGAQVPFDFATYVMRRVGVPNITEPFAARAWQQFLIQRTRGNRM